MDEPESWNRFWRRRVSRRRLLTGTALPASGLVAAAAVGCSSSDNGADNGGSASPGAGNDDVNATAISPYDGRRPYVPPPAGMTGGTLRFQGFDPVVLDRFDPHQTQFGPMYANLSSVFSKLYYYRSHIEPTHENILPDLATSVPEMVEPASDTLT